MVAKRECSKCRELKPLEMFYNNKKSHLGKAYYCKPCDDARTRERDVRTGARYFRKKRDRFHISREEYITALKEQKGVCAICEGIENVPNRKLAVDHCHTRMVFRGLLCTACNTRLFALENKPFRIKAEAYIKKHSKKGIPK